METIYLSLRAPFSWTFRYLASYLSIYLSIYLSKYISIYLYICISIYPSIYPSIYINILMYIQYTSIHRYIHLSNHLSIYPNIYTVSSLATTGFMKAVPSVYTLLMNTIYPSHSTQVAEGTVFRKHTVYLYLSTYLVRWKMH